MESERHIVISGGEVVQLSGAEWLMRQHISAKEFFFSSRRRHTRWTGDWSSDVCSSDLYYRGTLGNGAYDPAAPAVAGAPLINGQVARGLVGVMNSGLINPFSLTQTDAGLRSEERRVGKEGKCRRGPEAGDPQGQGR